MTEIELGRGVARSVAALLAAAAFSVGVSSASFAQNDALGQASSTQAQTVKEGKKAQEKIDGIDDQRGELFRDYKSTERDLERFRKYNSEQRTQIADQEKQMKSLHEQIARVGEIDAEVVPMISDMLKGFEQFVKEDVPFQLKKRLERVATLKKLMTNSDISVAEKFRRVLEAYQIENDFGRHIEAYEETVKGKDGKDNTLNYLQIGRVALFRQTPEGEHTQMWDRANRKWVDLPSRYSDAVKTGRQIAQKFIPPNLMVLPIIVPAQSAE